MLRQRSRAADESAPESTDTSPRLDLDIEAVHVRNYDHREGHSVHVRLEGRDVDSRLSERSYLAPGQSTRVSGAIEPGRYQLQVRVDGVERRRADLELDETPGGTAVVELGNGVVSVTRGA
jgi:hypothetical protein